jgi:hypothetical protein
MIRTKRVTRPTVLGIPTIRLARQLKTRTRRRLSELIPSRDFCREAVPVLRRLALLLGCSLSDADSAERWELIHVRERAVHSTCKLLDALLAELSGPAGGKEAPL